MGKKISKHTPDGAPDTARKPLRASFFLEFTVLFAVVALALSLATGIVLSRYLAGSIEDKVVDDALLDTRDHVSGHVTAAVSLEQLTAPLTGADYQRLDDEIRPMLAYPYLRVSLYNRDGTVIYSSEPAILGRSLPSEEVEKALAGDTVAETHGEPEGLGLSGYDRLLEIYTPLRLQSSSDIVGAVETYRDYAPVGSFIADIQKSIYIGIGAALAALYLALLLLVKRGSVLIRHQQVDLDSRGDELVKSYESIVAVLCSALDLRDNVTYGHAQRVSELASVMAWQMGLRKEQVRQIEKAAILHDIGKIGVADAVLSKPSALTESEWVEMKRHPELGHQILRDIDFLKDAADIVHAHHERYDGRGYPRGLKAKEIPLGARIFAVVDAYDAMTSHRPYRKAMPHRRAVEEIVRNSGTQFDPEVVKAFLEADRRKLLNGNRQGALDPELVAS